MKQKQKYIILFIVGCFVLTYFFFNSLQKEVIVYELSGAEETSKVDPINGETMQRNIKVHVEGQVNQPGVYELQGDVRVIDAVEAAGGLSDEADPSQINLAKRVYDEDSIYVPKKGEVVASRPTSTEQSSNKININLASAKELEILPGIGEALANRIIDYRTQNGYFKQIEDIKKVSGIGDKKFQEIKNLIVVN